MPKTALEGWHDYLKTQDLAALRALLHPDVVFESPVVHTPQRGREITLKYLASAGKVLGGPGFKYVGLNYGDALPVAHVWFVDKAAHAGSIRHQPFFTSGQALSLSGRNASSPGMTARSL
jgi:hypothetical protein